MSQGLDEAALIYGAFRSRRVITQRAQGSHRFTPDLIASFCIVVGVDIVEAA